MILTRTRLAVAELTALLTTDFDVPTLLHTLVGHARGCFEACSAVLILLDDRRRGGQADIRIVAESTSDGYRADPALHTSGPGPTSAHTGAVTMITDLHTADDTRWSHYRASALAAGMGGVRAFPVTALAVPLGALVIHTTGPWGATRPNELGQILADLSAVALSIADPHGRRVTTSDTIEAVLADTTTVSVAVGILAEYLDLSIDGARDRLVRLARAHNTTPTTHAKAITGAHNRHPGDPAASGLLHPPPDPSAPPNING
ncbi:hypothetical protein [Nocardia brasiliensis]|uniref:hypothetical protein n=1 Tax=Nocardia brasiliensis TaxID=37326 RepID=UPI00366FA010